MIRLTNNRTMGPDLLLTLSCEDGTVFVTVEEDTEAGRTVVDGFVADEDQVNNLLTDVTNEVEIFKATHADDRQRQEPRP